MKLRISIFRTLLIFLIATLLLGVMLFFICFNIFLDFPWDFRQPLIITLYSASAVVFFILTFTFNYYELNKKYVKVKRYSRELIYYFSDIVYIDKAKSEKKKVIHFYTRQGHARYLTFDQKGLVYKAMLDRCHNLLSDEEFHNLHPDVKL